MSSKSTIKSTKSARYDYAIDIARMREELNIATQRINDIHELMLTLFRTIKDMNGKLDIKLNKNVKNDEPVINKNTTKPVQKQYKNIMCYFRTIYATNPSKWDSILTVKIDDKVVSGAENRANILKANSANINKKKNPEDKVKLESSILYKSLNNDQKKQIKASMLQVNNDIIRSEIVTATRDTIPEHTPPSPSPSPIIKNSSKPVIEDDPIEPLNDESESDDASSDYD